MHLTYLFVAFSSLEVSFFRTFRLVSLIPMLSIAGGSIEKPQFRTIDDNDFIGYCQGQVTLHSGNAWLAFVTMKFLIEMKYSCLRPKVH